VIVLTITIILNVPDYDCDYILSNHHYNQEYNIHYPDIFIVGFVLSVRRIGYHTNNIMGHYDNQTDKESETNTNNDLLHHNIILWNKI
jgi:hypothetical protein